MPAASKPLTGKGNASTGPPCTAYTVHMLGREAVIYPAYWAIKIRAHTHPQLPTVKPVPNSNHSHLQWSKYNVNTLLLVPKKTNIHDKPSSVS